MQCLDWDEIEQLLTGQSDERLTSTLRQHLSSCDACRDRLRQASDNLSVLKPIGEILGQELRGEDATAAPQRLGDFRILRELGRGGMGVVYEAQQGEPPRHVAIKVLNRPGAVNPRRQHLFRRETQTLARLKHPGIAAIYEAHLSAGDECYFVMELVEGVSPLEFARQRTLNLQDRVRLFTQICDAVGYAHQRGILHRDLNPSNIRVDAAGRVKVLDFGLAKMIQDEVEPHESIATRVGNVLGTMPYMSPEQSRGDVQDMDVRSDVYSLGVMLYELLTGHLPYPLARCNVLEAAHIIGNAAPLPPSCHESRLKGDLETIILKALAKSADERYASVAALRDDLERCLTNQPILARAPTFGYHLRKLVVRHKAPFALAGTLAALMAATAVTVTLMAVRLDRERSAAMKARDDAAAAQQEAQRQAATAQAVSGFLADMLEAPNPERGSAARDTRVIDVLSDAGLALANAFPDQPRVEAEIRFTLGNTYRALGELEAAREQLQKSLDLLRTEQTQQPDSHDLQLAMARGLNKLARVVEQTGRRDDFDAAEAMYVEALAIRRAVLGEDHDEVAVALNNLGWHHVLRGNLDRAEQLLRESLRMRERLARGQTPELASTLNNLAIVNYRQRRIDDAIRLLRRSLEIDQRARGDDHPNVLTSMQNLAVMLGASGAGDEAAGMLDDLIERCRRVLGPNHPQVARALMHRAELEFGRGQFSQAETRYREALAIHEQAHGPIHPETAQTLHNIAVALTRQAQAALHPEARTLYQRALAIRDDLLGPLHAESIATLINLAALELQDGDVESAEARLTPRIAMLRETSRAPSRELLRLLNVRGECYTAMRRYDAAEADLLEAHELLNSQPQHARPELPRLQRALYALYESWAKPQQAAMWRSPDQNSAASGQSEK